MDESKKIFIISDSTGRTAKQVVKAALTQFSDSDVEILVFSDVRESDSAKEIISRAKSVGALVIHTLVDIPLRDSIVHQCRLMNVNSLDLMGPILNKLSNLFINKPSQTPGLFEKINREYFQRIDAVQFAFKHDDGIKLDDIKEAEIILLGVSRTFKTPLSVYLAYKGWFVINVPIVNGIQPPSILNEVDPKRVFCLTTNAHRLSELRSTRNEKLGGFAKEYADPISVRNEILFAMRYYTLHGWKIIDVTGKPIEEISSEILDILSKNS